MASLVAVGLTLILVFIADCLAPLGVAGGVGYVVAVALTLFSEREREVFIVAGAGAVLSLLAVWVKSDVGIPQELAYANRALGLAALGIVTGLVVAARRRAEGQLTAESERHATATLYEAALASTIDGVLLVESSGRIATANPAAHRIFGWAPGELVGHRVEELIPAHQRGAHEAQRALFAQAPQARSMAGARAVKALRKDSTELFVECVLAPAGGGGRVLVNVRDLTERHLHQERLRASQRLEAIGRLAGGIAHDFNNLLAVIINCAGFLDKGDALGVEARQDLDDIRDSARRGAELTKHLLAFSRRQIISPRRLDINALVKDLERMLIRIIGEDIELESKCTQGLWTVEIDAAQLEQVLINLVVNARDAMPAGGKLTVETANVTLDVGYARLHPDVVAGEYVMVAVSDTGVGMSEDVRERVFEPFFTTKGAGGSGMGLATVYGIVKQAKGHIWVYSEPGGGATFKVYIPRIEGSPELIAQRRAALTKGGSERILVVEDDPPVRRVVVRILRAAGYEVIEAASGHEAVRKLDAIGGELALLVTDVVMPQVGGREVADKALAAHPGLRVLFMSGYTENAIVHRGVLDPGLVFIEKPFREEDLLRRVRDLLDADVSEPERS
ncbi:MAG: response regulator [Deltaproteobacteria bacterium]|nr:response regulator [Deltaproteobacteria bacterium]